MKKVLTTLETATSWSPYKVETKKFLQDANNEVFAALIESIITQNLGSYSLSIPYVIEGCVLSGSNKTITAGKVFYNGIFYNTTSLTATATAPIKFVIEQSPDGVADPTIFSDNTTHNIHIDEHLKTYDNSYSTGVLFDATALVSVYGSKAFFDIKTSLYNTSSTSYVPLTSMTYTIPETGNYMITANSGFNFSNAAGGAGNGGYLQIWDGSSELAVSQNYLSVLAVNVDTAKLPLSCCYVGTITSGTVITLRVKMDNSFSDNFINNSLSIIQL